MTLWTGSEAAQATGGRATCDWQADGVSIDTRTLVPGDLFVALTAARDGHDFVARALAGGAAAAMVSRIPDDVPGDAPLLVVKDVQAGLEALGRAARSRSDACVVAVTGSVGKTSTKEMLACILADQGRTHASVASYNNHWGVPLTLARMPADTQFAVIEIGMNHPGEIAPLSRQARPHVAMVTTVAAAHLEAFGSLAGIAREKAAIMDGLEPGGVAVLNADLDLSPILFGKAAAVGARAIGFGEQARDWTLTAIRAAGDRTIATARIAGKAVTFDIGSPGRHFAMNALGALASAVALGAELAPAIASLGRWTPYRGRGQRQDIALPGGALSLLDDSYNANPASMEAALEVLAAAAGNRRVAFLGDMKELGPRAAELHADLAGLTAMDRVDRVHCIGPLMKSLHAALPPARRGLWSETSAEMIAALPDLIGAGDVVLAKGSLSMGLGRIVDAIREMGQSTPAPGPARNE